MPPLDFWGCALVLVKTLAYAATLSGAGTVMFAHYSYDLLSSKDDISLARWLRPLLLVAAAATGLNILLTAASIGGELGGMFDLSLVRMVWNTGQARATGLRLIGLALMSVSAGSPRLRTVPLAGSILAATSFAWVGHTHAAVEARPAIAALTIHLMGVAFWVGALMPLLLVMRGADMPRVASLISRFSAAAVVVVGTLTIAGASVLCFLLSSTSELWTTSYGRSVTLKLALVAVLVSLAALNRWRLTPRLRANRADAMRHLRWSIRFELVVAGGILITTAAMTVLTGPTVMP